MQRFLPAFAALGLAVAPLAARADDAVKPISLGTIKAWTAYTANEKSTMVCYVVGHPTKSLPANATRGRVDVQVTHRPGEKALNVVNFDLGYTAKSGSSAELDIDGKKFVFFTNKESAWASDAATDKVVANTLAKGRQAVIKATSDHGTSTVDTYALAGFGQALALADKACNVKR
jgi:hypothetical protein